MQCVPPAMDKSIYSDTFQTHHKSATLIFNLSKTPPANFQKNACISFSEHNFKDHMCGNLSQCLQTTAETASLNQVTSFRNVTGGLGVINHPLVW